MSDSLITRTPSAYDYPLLIKNLLFCPAVDAPDQEIVYRNHRFTYRDLRQRVAQLANALTRLGIKRGDTVAVMDWDSHRYLECFFCRTDDRCGCCTPSMSGSRRSRSSTPLIMPRMTCCWSTANFCRSLSRSRDASSRPKTCVAMCC